MPGFLVHGAPVRLCVGLACVLSLWNTVTAIKEEAKKENMMTFLPATVSGNKEVKKEKAGAFLGATELPARSVDLSALNLTQVVNGMLSRALKESKKFFSLLSITSYSSFAFHKVSVAIYNISHLKTVDPAKFPTRHCYCVNNRTNDLSDFTALLVDFIGNSTSYLTEIFKSTSILSVSQTNESDCIFVCVMTGKSGRNLSDFWEVAEESPVVNYTFTSSLSGVPGEPTRGTAVASNLTPTSQQMLPRTSPPHIAQSTSRSALRTSPRTETTRPSQGEQTVNTDSLPELLAKATATLGSISSTLPGLATRRVTANRQAWASRLPVPWAQTTHEEAPGGPPWKPLPSGAVSPAEAQQSAQTGTLGSLPGPPARTQGSLSQASPTSGTFTPGTQTSSPTKAPAPRYPETGDFLWPFTLGEEPALVLGLHQVQVSRCPRQLLREGAVTTVPVTLTIQKLNPCLMELCRFFQQCLCVSQRRDPRMQAMRFCLDSYAWFLKNATYICQKAKRVPHSPTLKQRCLENICKSV
ncbi:HERV-H LTR-associating protein 1 [Sturnira hondurensis]|uniref:HERV-H LTR-associating protein 1 n=1 Tax=Sturnira hondurensis TaxID=192404 RepID=UPI00187AB9FA|nr:HERV-H LTR-associating protein 1 [Sturnira hondurensis]